MVDFQSPGYRRTNISRYLHGSSPALIDFCHGYTTNGLSRGRLWLRFCCSDSARDWHGLTAKSYAALVTFKSFKSHIFSRNITHLLGNGRMPHGGPASKDTRMRCSNRGNVLKWAFVLCLFSDRHSCVPDTHSNHSTSFQENLFAATLTLHRVWLQVAMKIKLMLLPQSTYCS